LLDQYLELMSRNQKLVSLCKNLVF